MRILKTHPILKMVNSYLIDSPQPSNISYLWNFGSLLAFCLIIQIVTGVTLGMHYTPNALEAFDSVEHIMRDVNNGWLIRYLHSNTASAFFFLVYLHIGRGLYYGSYKAPRTLTWTIGTVILILMMATAFLGYKYSPKCYKLNSNKNNTKTKCTGERICIVKKNHLKKTVNQKRLYSTKSLDFLEVFSSKVYSKEVSNFLQDKNIKPVFVYEDLSINRSSVLNDTRNLSGIYLILNKSSMDYYVGSASTGRFHARLSNHLFNLNGSKVLKNAVNKYGIYSFAFIILELFPCEGIVTKENNKELLDLEDFYLKSLLPNYNILTEAGSSFGYKHTEITRIKMKTNYSDERRSLIGNLNKGKKLSQETIEAIKIASFNRRKPVYSLESRENLKKKSKGLLVYNLNYTVFAKFPSIIEASKHLGCDEKTIRRALQTEKKLLRRRWIVKLI